MHAVLQLTLFGALVLVWILLDRIKHRKSERVRHAHQQKQSGKEF